MVSSELNSIPVHIPLKNIENIQLNLQTSVKKLFYDFSNGLYYNISL